MSESEIKEAKARTQQASERFEASLDRVASQMENGAGVIRNIGSDLTDAASAIGDELKQRLLKPLDDYLTESVPRAEQVIEDIRISAENELKLMDRHPIAAWTTVFLGGLFLGILAAQASSPSHKKTTGLRQPQPLH